MLSTFDAPRTFYRLEVPKLSLFKELIVSLGNFPLRFEAKRNTLMGSGRWLRGQRHFFLGGFCCLLANLGFLVYFSSLWTEWTLDTTRMPGSGGQAVALASSGAGIADSCMAPCGFYESDSVLSTTAPSLQFCLGVAFCCCFAVLLRQSHTV